MPVLTCYSIVWRAIPPFRELLCQFVSPFELYIFHYRYNERTPRPANPILRPAYQGSNPVADVFSMWALRTTVDMLPRVAKDQSDHEALRQML